jgi:hypothetical protein
VGLLAEFAQQYFPYLMALLLWALLCRRLTTDPNGSSGQTPGVARKQAVLLP